MAAWLRRCVPLPVVAVACLSVVAACAGGSGGQGADSGRVDVVVSFYPLQFVTEAVGGRHVSVSNLTPPGADSHNVELPAAQVGRVLEADLVVYLSGFQPSTDTAVALRDRGPVVDTADVAATARETAGSGSRPAAPPPSDPHFWLDPTLLAAAGHQVARELTAVDPANGDDYASAAARLAASLDVLDAEYAAGLDACRGATLVTAHEAFGYLAARYGLRQVGIAGINPEVEPSPARLREVMEVVEANGVRTLFFETPASPRLTQTLAADLGVSMSVLDPVERLRDTEDDYMSIMRANLRALQEGLVCSSG